MPMMAREPSIRESVLSCLACAVILALVMLYPAGCRKVERAVTPAPTPAPMPAATITPAPTPVPPSAPPDVAPQPVSAPRPTSPPRARPRALGPLATVGPTPAPLPPVTYLSPSLQDRQEVVIFNHPGTYTVTLRACSCPQAQDWCCSTVTRQVTVLDRGFGDGFETGVAVPRWAYSRSAGATTVRGPGVTPTPVPTPIPTPTPVPQVCPAGQCRLDGGGPCWGIPAPYCRDPAGECRELNATQCRDVSGTCRPC